MSAPTREQWLAVTRDITANVQRMIDMLLDTFPDPPPCPSWCDGKHGIDPDDWESQDGGEVPTTVYRSHGHHIGDIGGKVGVDVVADTSAERGAEPVTSEPVLSLWTHESDATLSGTEARQFADLIVKAADELEYDILGGGSK